MKIENILIAVGLLMVLGGCAHNEYHGEVIGINGVLDPTWPAKAEWNGTGWEGVPEECRPLYDTEREFQGWYCGSDDVMTIGPDLVTQEDLDRWEELRNNVSLAALEVPADDPSRSSMYSPRNENTCWGLPNTSVKFCCDGWIRNDRDYKIIHISEAFRQSTVHHNLDLRWNGDVWMDWIGRASCMRTERGCVC